jgi:hypothetical protein
MSVIHYVSIQVIGLDRCNETRYKQFTKKSKYASFLG